MKWGSLTPALERQMIKAVRRGLNSEQVAQQFGCSDTTVRSVRKAHGLSAPTGRQRQAPRREAHCKQCGRRFSFWAIASKPIRVFCGQRCCAAAGRDRHRKLPKDGRTRRALLMRLYWKEKRSTPEIAKLFNMNHKGILGAMRTLQILRRPVGPTRHLHCIEPGCTRPIYRILHKTNGTWYGRRCYLHWVVFRFRANQPKGESSWERRNRRLLRRATRIVRAVSSMPNGVSVPAWTSLT